MKYLFAIGASILLLSAACSTTKEVVGTEVDEATEISEINDQQNQHTTEHQIIFEDVAQGDSMFAHIKRGYCYGMCPVYEMKIYNSGYTEYNGIHAVDKKGLYSAMLSYDEMKMFVDQATEMGYMGMKDKYDNPNITDLPSSTTSIVLGGTRKQVTKRFDFPRSLISYEKIFDNLMKTKDWKFIKETQK